MTDQSDRDAHGLEAGLDEVRVRINAVAELRRALDASGGSATALAKKAGVSPSTITRPLKDPKGASLPKWATIVKILEAAGLAPETYGGPTRMKSDFRIIEIVGDLRPGVWFTDLESRDFGEDIALSMGMLRPSGPLSAFNVGPEGVPFAPGTIAIVDSGGHPESGDHLVFRDVDDAGKTETFAALFQIEATRPVLYKTGADGRSQRFAGQMLSSDLPEIGTLIGPVIATLWVKP